jgi:tripartite-type tricarboxylate transporter receptor subunit TctC
MENVMNVFRSLKIGSLVPLALVMLGSVVQAQSYPDRTVKIIVPYSAGGSVDVLTRAVAAQVSKMWNVPVIVEARPGAAGIVGMAVVAKSPPGGWGVAMATSGFATTPSLYPSQALDVAKDFETLGTIASTPMVLTVPPSLPAKTLAELTALAKQSPGGLTYGSCGIGSPMQLAVELYRTMAGLEMVHVPYRGCNPAVTDMLGGRVQLLVATVGTVLAHIQSGALRPIAVTTKYRSSLLPDVPTFEQSGLKGYDLDSWFGLMAPANTPEPIQKKIHEDVLRAVKTPEVAEKLVAVGFEILTTTREEHSTILKNDLAMYSKLIGGLDIRMDDQK